jgi:glycosyltransferase involved in cell wall biosynthesis
MTSETQHPPQASGIDSVSIVLPAKNEAESLRGLLPNIRREFPDAEIIVVDDGSTDETAKIAMDNRVRLLQHPYSMGNGAAIKSGARAATGSVVVFMDADGQHDPAEIPALLQLLEQGYDMAVGARSFNSQASLGRGLANTFYNRMCSWMVNQEVRDLTSGFRAARTGRFREFLYLLPNGFSYPTTSTMAFFRAGYPVAYYPIHARERIGKSHISPLRDGLRFLLIIFRIGTLYSPLKLFVPISFLLCITGLGYYLYTFLTLHRFTNMSALLLTSSLTIFLIGLVSEQITMMMYQKSGKS